MDATLSFLDGGVSNKRMSVLVQLFAHQLWANGVGGGASPNYRNSPERTTLYMFYSILNKIYISCLMHTHFQIFPTLYKQLRFDSMTAQPHLIMYSHIYMLP